MLKNKIIRIFVLSLLMLSVSLPVLSYSSSHKTVYIAGKSDFYPIEYYNDAEKKFDGVMPEIFKELSEKTGINFKYVQNGASQQEIAENLRAEVVSSYVVGTYADYIKDTLPIFSFEKDGKKMNIGIAFTPLANDRTISAIKSAAGEIKPSDINGYFYTSLSALEKLEKRIFAVLFICAFLILIILILLIMRLKTDRENNNKSKMTDHETGLGNRLYFSYHFEHTISDFSRSLYYVAYIIIDTNYLQIYHGASTFKDVIKHTASVLASYASDTDIAARITENGFVFAFRMSDHKKAEDKTKEIIDKLNSYTDVQEDTHKPIFHAALYKLDSFDKNLQLILFNLRRNCIKILGTAEHFVLCDSRDMNTAFEEKGMLEDFDRGFKNKEFKLYMQFIVDNKTKKIVAAEALSRWENPEKGIVMPSKYIGAMETAGLISKFDFYMFDLVCQQLEKWKDTEFSNLSLSCNFTRITLSEDEFLEKIMNIVHKYSFNRSKLVMEITEDVIEYNLDNALNNVSKCKKMGFTIALDDLGSGYTSLLNLCSYPIDTVKIDRNILLKTNEEIGKSLFEGLVSLAHSINLRVVCEGVENSEQDKFVSLTNCDLVQGWYYSRVFPSSEGEDFVKYYTQKLLKVNK